MLGSMFFIWLSAGTKLYSQPDSYASSEGKANRRGTGMIGRCQTWIRDRRHSSVLGMTKTRKRENDGHVSSRQYPNAKMDMPKCEDRQTRTVFKKTEAWGPLRKASVFWLKGKQSVETLSIDRAQRGDDIYFIFFSHLPTPHAFLDETRLSRRLFSGPSRSSSLFEDLNLSKKDTRHWPVPIFVLGIKNHGWLSALYWWVAPNNCSRLAYLEWVYFDIGGKGGVSYAP